MSRDDLTFGWFLPTSGDTTCLGDPAARIAQSPEVFDEIVEAVDNGGFKYLLMPVNATCWEATVVASYYAARTRNVAPLIAIRRNSQTPALNIERRPNRHLAFNSVTHACAGMSLARLED